jgi:hypothetical protein
MAERDIVGGLFGMTPESYQQGMARRDSATNLTAAQLTPGQLAGFYAMEAGTGLGRAAQGLLGVEDPQLAMIRDVQQMRSQFDVSTPTGLRSFAQALGQKGYTDFAIQATAKAADIDKDIAAAFKSRREAMPTPQNQAEAAKLSSLQSQYPDTVEGRAMAADKFAEWKSEFKQKEAKAGAPVAEQQDKALRDARVKKLLDYEDRSTTASQTLQLVQDFNSVLNNAFTGTASGAKLTAGQVANALGVTVTGTTESEQLDQLFAALTVGQAKNLKGALSDKDVKFLKEAVGSRGLTKDTLVAVINRIAREAEVDKAVYNKASGFKGDLAQFDFAKAQDESRKEINERLAKQQRLNELRNKQGQPGR